MPPQASCNSKNIRRTRVSKGAAARRETATPRGFRFHVNAGRATANGIHARQLGGGPLQGIVNAVEMILRIGLDARIPGHLFAEDHFAIHHAPRICDRSRPGRNRCGSLPDGGPAAWPFLFPRDVLEACCFDCEWPAMDALPDEFPIEGARSFGRVNAAQVFGDSRIRRRSSPGVRPFATAGTSAAARCSGG